jgi:pimeloyl-CoA synthetase
MAESKTGERLERLAESGISSCEKVSDYTEELKELSEKNLTTENALMKSKFFKALADTNKITYAGVAY